MIIFRLLLVWDHLRYGRHSPSIRLGACYDPPVDPLRHDRCSPPLVSLGFYHCCHLSVLVPLRRDKHYHSLAYHCYFHPLVSVPLGHDKHCPLLAYQYHFLLLILNPLRCDICGLLFFLGCLHFSVLDPLRDTCVLLSLLGQFPYLSYSVNLWFCCYDRLVI